MKRLMIILTVVLLLVTANIYADSVNANIDEINLLIIYQQDTKGYLDIYQNYKQSLIPNLKVDAKALNDINKNQLNKYQSIYLDRSIIDAEQFQYIKEDIISFVKEGGHIFLEDVFYNEFPLEFIGAKSFVEVEQFPTELAYPKTNSNLGGLQDVVRLFHRDVNTYYDKGTLDKSSKGYGFIPSTSLSLVKSGDTTIYGLNKYGKGSVLFANSFLPNYDYITGFDLLKKSENQKYFNYGFSTANYLLRNEYVSYISKTIYGYSVEKVLGTYGRPAMAWQNHFEVGSALRDGSMGKWIDILKEYNQIPSYSLARTLFEWGTWKESITIHKNIGDMNTPKFAGVEVESHYSSGEHLMTDTDYMTLKEYPEKKDLASSIELPYRAYPTIGDLNGDGILDIVSGSSDGYLYLFKGKSYNRYQEKIKLIDAVGNPIKVGSYSAPVFVDINGDGRLDLVVGSGEGNIELFLNNGDNTFRKSTTIENKDMKNTTPTIGDIDGDGVLDLILGESTGTISVYKGSKDGSVLSFNKNKVILKSGKENANVGKYPALAIKDIDGDNELDLLVGDATGYIKRYSVNYPNIEYKSYIEGESLNRKGDRRLWGGYYAVPVLRDLNGDGTIDLIVGQIEFGLPVAIDSDMFLYKEDLKKSLEDAKANYIDIYPHVYFQPYKASSQEKMELELHKKAFNQYGIPWKNTGVNQHTWNISNAYPIQTLLNEKESGIKWNSGFRPSLVAGEPTLSRDYIWTIPFKLSSGESDRDFMLFNPSPNIPILEKAYDSLSYFDLPITYFYHMEYGVNTESGLKGLRQKAETLEKIRNKGDYNFMMEPQMFDAFEANTDAAINIKKTENEYVLSTKFQDIKNNPYSKVVGIKFELSDDLKNHKIHTDSNIYHRDGSKLYMGLEEETKVYISREEDRPHISRVNGPVKIYKDNETNIHNIELDYQGLQQIKLYSPKGIEIVEGDFQMESQGNFVVLTRYGDKTKLRLKYLGENK